VVVGSQGRSSRGSAVLLSNGQGIRCEPPQFEVAWVKLERAGRSPTATAKVGAFAPCPRCPHLSTLSFPRRVLGHCPRQQDNYHRSQNQCESHRCPLSLPANAGLPRLYASKVGVARV